MNDLGVLATSIVTYNFPADTGKFPKTFVSGWLETNIGLLNGLTHEEFSINSTGAFEPYPLAPVEESIYKTLYDIYYYQRASRYALKGIVWDSSLADAMIMVKEGDSTIQRTSKHQVARTFSDLAKAAEETLNNLVFQYNSSKAAPRQVVGANDDYYHRSWEDQT